VSTSVVEPAARRRRKFWGWGFEDEQPAPDELRRAAEAVCSHLGFGGGDVELPASLDDVELPPPRLRPPRALERICSTGNYERAAHAYGKSYRDVVRAFRARFDHPPDVVAFPTEESEVVSLLEWCAEVGAAAIPYGGGTSVVGGVEPAVGDGYAGTVSIDLGQLDRVLEVDAVSRAARIQAGASGPRLEDQLRGHGLTLRHFPQSFEFSTLGGWIATRAGGHFATLYTHIDDLVESVRAVTPTGVTESRRLPGSGAGPSPDRLLIGSEGILGVITEAWVRVQARPEFKSSVAVRFGDFAAGAEAVRRLSQSGLYPSNCRLLDPGEAAITGAVQGGSGSRPASKGGSPSGPSAERASPSGPSVERASPSGDALLILGFESADHPVDAWMERALECCADFGGLAPAAPSRREKAGRAQARDRVRGGTGGRQRRDRGAGRNAAASEDAVGAWRQAFLGAPYLRDTFVAAGILSETFETAITWDRFPDFYADVMTTAEKAVREACGDGRVTCRFTHVYPDGPAPYFTLLAPARRGAELEQWGEIKAAASEAVLAGGGTITHHHAVGRDHRPWYDRQRPEPFARALAAAKSTLDPQGILNPGVLIEPL
jgi:alkyldihydroxyacetonephosphate synthase